MNIVIKRLSSDLLEDYLTFFDSEDHSDNIAEHKCYCVCWCSDDHRTGAERMSSAEKRRALAAEYIKKGLIQGYLAYINGKAVGWCNANTKSDCNNCISWLRLMKQANETEASPEIKVKSVFCFTVAPSMRRKGIASELLDRVCKDAVNDGFCFIEAYPNKKMKELDDYNGPLEMYKKSGFYVHKEYGDFLVVRKKLR